LVAPFALDPVAGASCEVEPPLQPARSATAAVTPRTYFADGGIFMGKNSLF
jgi:hypothetical protein